jgi:hypothetical protein
MHDVVGEHTGERQFLAQGVGLVRSSRSGGGKAGGGRKGRESLGLATLGDLSPPSTPSRACLACFVSQGGVSALAALG